MHKMPSLRLIEFLCKQKCHSLKMTVLSFFVFFFPKDCRDSTPAGDCQHPREGFFIDACFSTSFSQCTGAQNHIDGGFLAKSCCLTWRKRDCFGGSHRIDAWCTRSSEIRSSFPRRGQSDGASSGLRCAEAPEINREISRKKGTRGPSGPLRPCGYVSLQFELN